MQRYHLGDKQSIFHKTSDAEFGTRTRGSRIRSLAFSQKNLPNFSPHSLGALCSPPMPSSNNMPSATSTATLAGSRDSISSSLLRSHLNKILNLFSQATNIPNIDSNSGKEIMLMRKQKESGPKISVQMFGFASNVKKSHLLQ
jgi:hypothetical protein